MNVLLCWESIETNSWNPVLAASCAARGWRHRGARPGRGRGARPLGFRCVPAAVPRRGGAYDLPGRGARRSGIPMLNSRDSRRRCENKALAHLAFEAHGITQPPSFVWSADGVRDRQVEWQGETLLKPLYGNRSSGIEICDSLPRRSSGRRTPGGSAAPADHLAGTLLADRRRADGRGRRSLLAPASR